MRFVLSILSIAILSLAAEYMFPWWSLAVVAFMVSLLISQTRKRSFLSGFVGAGVAWLAVLVIRDNMNDHILATRMAGVFHLPGYPVLILLVGVIGGLVGGLAAWTASLMRPAKV